MKYRLQKKLREYPSNKPSNPLSYEVDFWSKIIATTCRTYWQYFTIKLEDQYIDLQKNWNEYYNKKSDIYKDLSTNNLVDIKPRLYKVKPKYLIYFPSERGKIEWSIPVSPEQVAEASAIEMILREPNRDKEIYKYIPARYIEFGDKYILETIYNKN